MLRLALLFIPLFIFSSCANQVKETNDPSSGILEGDSITAKSMPTATSCLFSNPDTSIDGISLRNAASSAAFLGKGKALKGGDMQYFYSSDKKQVLGLKVHPGDENGQVSIFEMGYATDDSQPYQKTDMSVFGTGHGFKLGLSKNDIVKTLGTCYMVKDSTAESIEIYYSLELPNDSKTNLLARNNMPAYYASYKFKNDVLDHIIFGFEMP